MSKENVRSPFCARPGSLPGYRFVFVFLASLVTSLAFAAERDSDSGELVRFVRSAAALIEQEGETAFPKFREAGGPWFRGDEYVSEVLPPGSDPEPFMQRLLDDILIPVIAIRAYRGDEDLIAEWTVRMRGS